MWFKIVVACIPAAIVGILFDDKIDELFYNYQTVALALIIVGIAFIIVEKKNKGRVFMKTKLSDITYKDAVIIGLFQLIAAIFPGTSRSGATIVGAIIFGVSRGLATEFTFFLAIPVMFKKHDFTVFGWYRIILGIIVILYFLGKTFIF